MVGADEILFPGSTVKFEFNFDAYLRREYRIGLNPFRPICKSYANGNCPNGKKCIDRHIIPPNITSHRIVCKHWLRGLCKKSNNCEFLHEYNLRRMPECTFFARNGYCTQSPDCLYLHVDPLSKIPPCPNYTHGFCKLGPKCIKRHIRKQFCTRYLVGFCPFGPKCPDAHPKFSYMMSNHKRLSFDYVSDNDLDKIEQVKGVNEDEHKDENKEKQDNTIHQSNMESNSNKQERNSNVSDTNDSDYEPI